MTNELILIVSLVLLSGSLLLFYRLLAKWGCIA